jgi:hypothetical protein
MIPKNESLIVLSRDGMRCKFCTNIGTELHHCFFASEYIVPKKYKNTHRNLINICRRDHSAIHSYTPRGKILNIKAKTWSMNSYKWDKTTKEKMKLKLLRLKIK